MNANEIRGCIQQAEEEESKGHIHDSLQLYLKALRVVTPDDFQIEQAIAIVGIEGKSVVESPEADIMDSFLRAKIIKIYRELGDLESAYHHAVIALFLDRNVWGEFHNNTSASYHDLGSIEHKRQNFSDSDKWFAKSTEIDNHLLTTNLSEDIRNVILYRKLVTATHLGELGYFVEAAKESLKIIPDIDTDFPDIIKLSDAINCGALALQNICEHHKAKDVLHKAIALQTEAHLEKHPQMGRLYDNMAILLHELWEFDASAVYVAKSLMFDQTGFDTERKRSTVIEEENKALEQLISRQQSVQNSEYDVFLSFNTHDREIVEKLHDSLESHRLRTWIFWEQKEWKKQKTPEEIINNISHKLLLSKIVVMIASGASITSEYVLKEVEHCVDNNIPLLIWFPEGVRLRPVTASTKSNLSEIHLLNFMKNTFRPGVYSLFGYGMREPEIKIVSQSIRAWFQRINANLTNKNSLTDETLLTPTRLLPVLVDDKNNLLFRELI